MHTSCKAQNQKGEPCGADHYQDGWCYWHHPDLEEQRREDRRKGGKARSNAARARKHLKRFGLEDVDAILCTTLEGVLEGKIEPGVANSAATVARAIQAVRTATEHEQRISELEELLKHQGGQSA